VLQPYNYDGRPLGYYPQAEPSSRDAVPVQRLPVAAGCLNLRAPAAGTTASAWWCVQDASGQHKDRVAKVDADQVLIAAHFDINEVDAHFRSGPGHSFVERGGGRRGIPPLIPGSSPPGEKGGGGLTYGGCVTPPSVFP
jgi:hypothetical protein